jgi:drug/metabolite transporter (DMT)-like permease
LLVVTIRGQEPLTMPRGFGFALAFIGVLIIRNVESFTFANQTFIGDILTVINCLSYALFLSYSKKFLEKHDSLWSTTWLFIYGSVGLTLLAAPDWTQFHWTPPSANMWAAMVFAILGATLATYFLSFWALAHAKASKIAMFIFLQPVVTSIVAVIWLGEVITLRKVLASLLIFLGFYLAIFERKQPLINS